MRVASAPGRRKRGPAAAQEGPSLDAAASAEQPEPEAAILLSHIATRFVSVEAPIVQLLQVSANPNASSVARCLAQAGPARMGRTLLAGLRQADPEPATGGALLSPHAGSGRPRGRRAGSPVLEVLPDIAWPGLYHAQLGSHYRMPQPVAGSLTTAWLGDTRLEFHFLIFDCGPIAGCPAALELSARCHGSILVVAAGVTRPSEIETAARQVRLAGGTVMGSVLYHAQPAGHRRGPPAYPRFLLRRWRNSR